MGMGAGDVAAAAEPGKRTLGALHRSSSPEPGSSVALTPAGTQGKQTHASLRRYQNN